MFLTIGQRRPGMNSGSNRRMSLRDTGSAAVGRRCAWDFSPVRTATRLPKYVRNLYKGTSHIELVVSISGAPLSSRSCAATQPSACRGQPNGVPSALTSCVGVAAFGSTGSASMRWYSSIFQTPSSCTNQT